MSIGRRQFLKAMAASPVAGKQLAGEVNAQFEQLSVGRLGGGSPLMNDWKSAAPAGIPYIDGTLSVVSRYVALMGIPGFVEDDIRERARFVHSLDPDIACKRSWSFAVKIATQRQRNYERLCQEIHTAAKRQEGKALFATVAGAPWPW